MLNQNTTSAFRAFQGRVRAIVQGGEKFALLAERSPRIPKEKNHFDRLRGGRVGIHLFERAFEALEMGNVHPIGRCRLAFFYCNQWTTTKDLMKFVQDLPGRPTLLGPQGLAIAIRFCSNAMPACKTLVSLQSGDENEQRILAAGRCIDGTWALNVHSGYWTPGTIIMVSF
ncbi:MAG: hypothetical protein WCO21_00760 [bacterium]